MTSNLSEIYRLISVPVSAAVKAIDCDNGLRNTSKVIHNPLVTLIFYYFTARTENNSMSRLQTNPGII